MALKLLQSRGDCLQQAGPTNVGPLTDYTVSAWVKRQAVIASAYECLWALNNRAALFMRYSSADVIYAINTASQLGAGAYTFPLDVWLHVAARRSGTNFRYFINGVKSADLFSSDATTIDDSVPWLIGTNTLAMGARPSCLVADWGFWSWALSDADILSLYETRVPLEDMVNDHGFGSPTTAYRLNDRTGLAVQNSDLGLILWGAEGGDLVILGGAPTWEDDSPFPDPTPEGGSRGSAFDIESLFSDDEELNREQRRKR